MTSLVRYLGALALLAVGVDHIEQYYVDSYSVIPTIGTLFVLNFAAATLVAAGLLAPVGRIAGRWADKVLALLALGGFGIAAGSLGALLISEHGGLFGFVEQGYRQAIVLSITFDVAAMGLLALFLAALAESHGGDGPLHALQQRDALDVRRLREHVDRPHAP
jgi:hypothetical protein